MRKRALLLVIIGAVVVAAVVVAVLTLRRSAPAAVRLLPAADAFVYLDLTPLRRAGVLKQMPAVSLELEYEQFVRETGFQFERDLDEAAFAVHLPSTVEANPQQPGETRYSEVFVGRFDAGKLAAYLGKLAATVERYRGLDVYAIALPGRTVRVVILSPKMVAASNTEGAYALQGIVDRYKELTPAGGPELVRKYYGEVPIASVAWAITQTIASGPQGNAVFVLPGGYNVFLPAGTAVVASVRYLGSVQVTANALTSNEEQARRVSEQVNAFLAVFRTIEGAQAGGSDPDIKAFFDSMRVEQHGTRAELTATIPPGFVKKLVAETPGLTGAAPAPEPEKKKPAPRRRHPARKR